MKTAIIVCAVVGIATVATTLAAGHAKPDRATEDYGRRLMTAVVPHRLACASCHLDAGAEPGDLTLANAITRYPGDRIRLRINECVKRNMNSQALPDHSDEMTAMIAWLRFLGGSSAATEAAERQSHDPAPFQTPARPADPASGERLFEQRCADCHGKDGAGLPASRDPAVGYLFPPLWGPESFPYASDMNRARTLAGFIKAKMPLGSADLPDVDAWDVAAYIASKPRAHPAQ